MYQLVLNAENFYRKEVVTGKKRYGRFVEDFINRNTYIDCERACCKNVHAMNLNILHGLLSEGHVLFEQFAISGELSFDTFERMMQIYDADTPPPVSTAVTRQEEPLSFGCTFTEKQIVHIANCARENCLFLVSELTANDVKDLLDCKPGFQIHVANIRKLAYLFDCLLELCLINSDWKSVLGKGKYLLSPKDSKPISASSLSSSLSAFKKSESADKKKIRIAINELSNVE